MSPLNSHGGKCWSENSHVVKWPGRYQVVYQHCSQLSLPHRYLLYCHFKVVYLPCAFLDSTRGGNETDWVDTEFPMGNKIPFT